MPFRVGMAQIHVAGGQPNANLDRAISRIKEAAACGCRLVVETELGTLGLTICGVSFPVSKVAAQTVLGRDRSEACDSQAKWP